MAEETSNKFVFTAPIIFIDEPRDGDKNGKPWKSVSFKTEEHDKQYPQGANFNMFGIDKVNKFMSECDLGDLVEVHFNLKLSPKGYQNLDVWKVVMVTKGLVKYEPVELESDPVPEANTGRGVTSAPKEVVDDDLPF